MKPLAPFETSRRSVPPTDYCFHAGFQNWRGSPSPNDGEDRSDIRRFHDFSRQNLLESARERFCEGLVFALVVAVSAWPVIYMVIQVIQLLLRALPLN